jgi:hypothetical protein
MTTFTPNPQPAPSPLLNGPNFKPSFATMLATHPYQVLLCAFLTVASTVFGVWSYFASIKAPDLCFYAHPVRSTIVKAGATGLTVNYLGRQIKGDLCVAQFAIWNAGNEAIHFPSDKLKDIAIVAKSGAQILQAELRESTIPEIGMKLNTQDMQNGKVGVDWRVLEHNDGGVIQIVYEGSQDAIFQADGMIEGQRAIDILEKPAKGDAKPEKSQIEFTSKPPNVFMIPFLIWLTSSVVNMLLNVVWRKKSEIVIKIAYWNNTIGNVIFCFLAVIVVIYELFLTRKTPFSF